MHGLQYHRNAPHSITGTTAELLSIVDTYAPPQLSFARLVPTYQVLLRLFYCCGLRLSEGCFLRRSCVDLIDGVLHILQSKGNKDRIVFMSRDVCHMCIVFDEYRDGIIPNRQWFFPGGKGDRPFEKTSLDRKFAQFWNKTAFTSQVDRKPTIQSLRHTFVVNKMNEWMEDDVDTGIMMPYLSRYLGHSSIAETQYLSIYHATVPLKTNLLFFTIIKNSANAMSESNVERFMAKYANEARAQCISVPSKVHPYMFKRTRATQLLRHQNNKPKSQFG